jgi:hypothetical protein
LFDWDDKDFGHLVLGFFTLMKREWIHCDANREDFASFQFVNSLRKFKRVVSSWTITKRKEKDRDLKLVEVEIKELFDKNVSSVS